MTVHVQDQVIHGCIASLVLIVVRQSFLDINQFLWGFTLQAFGEVNKSFIRKIVGELEQTWIDENNNRHTISYNGDLMRSLVTDGWLEWRNFYGIHGNQRVALCYVGASTFQITIFKGHSQPKSFPRNHSCYPRDEQVVCFNMNLNRNTVNASRLVGKLWLFVFNSSFIICIQILVVKISLMQDLPYEFFQLINQLDTRAQVRFALLHYIFCFGIEIVFRLKS